jgi:hypothetical protein
MAARRASQSCRARLTLGRNMAVADIGQREGK